MEVDSSKLTIAIVGNVKNVGESSAQDMAEIGTAFEDFRDLKWLLVELNSPDNTVRKLQETSECISDFNLISLGSGESILLLGDWLSTKVIWQRILGTQEFRPKDTQFVNTCHSTGKSGNQETEFL